MKSKLDVEIRRSRPLRVAKAAAENASTRIFRAVSSYHFDQKRTDAGHYRNNVPAHVKVCHMKTELRACHETLQRDYRAGFNLAPPA